MFLGIIERKNRILEEVSTLLDNRSIRRSLSDHHSRRRPRACGLTIHTGVGCPFECRYCYIYSMGFPNTISRYLLEPIELLYSILSNPYFIPGEYGTFLALGSVTEPLHNRVLDYTIELLSLFNKYLGNPVQLSTKMALDSESGKALLNSYPKISYLVTVVALSNYRVIEPKAPDPFIRIKALKTLNALGIHTYLFIRPIIPGYTDHDIDEILNLALDNGTDRAVFGTLRVNKHIIKQLASSGVDTQPILNRVRKPLQDKRQVNIYGSDIKNKLVDKAVEKGFKVFPSACAANIDAAGQACSICRYGPCGDPRLLPRITEKDVIEFLEYLGFRDIHVSIEVNKLSLSIDRRYKSLWNKERGYVTNFLETVSRRKLVLR